MKVALMQPYFFPYIGYFQLIAAVDEFIIFDQAQFVRRSWMTRNRIGNEQKESLYVHVPVRKAPVKTKINEIQINNDANWQDQVIRQLGYYKKAPYYEEVLSFIKQCFVQQESSLSNFNTSIIKQLCERLGIATKITVLSEKFPDLNEAEAADEWGINVAKAMRANTYINALGGSAFYSEQKYNEHGLAIYFIRPNLPQYRQLTPHFTPGLSIIDVMMFNDLHTVKEMVKAYELVQKEAISHII